MPLAAQPGTLPERKSNACTSLAPLALLYGITVFQLSLQESDPGIKLLCQALPPLPPGPVAGAYWVAQSVRVAASVFPLKISAKSCL